MLCLPRCRVTLVLAVQDLHATGAGPQSVPVDMVGQGQMDSEESETCWACLLLLAGSQVQSKPDWLLPAPC